MLDTYTWKIVEVKYFRVTYMPINNIQRRMISRGDVRKNSEKDYSGSEIRQGETVRKRDIGRYSEWDEKG